MKYRSARSDKSKNRSTKPGSAQIGRRFTPNEMKQYFNEYLKALYDQRKKELKEYLDYLEQKERG